jgi:hypothetical protein
MEISAEVVLKTGGRRTIETQLVKMSAENPGIYALKIDLRSQLGIKSQTSCFVNFVLKSILGISRWGRYQRQAYQRAVERCFKLEDDCKLQRLQRWIQNECRVGGCCPLVSKQPASQSVHLDQTCKGDIIFRSPISFIKLQKLFYFVWFKNCHFLPNIQH